MEHIYITLLTSSSLSSFTTQIEKLNLEGPWEVALTEISYPISWLNVPSIQTIEILKPVQPDVIENVNKNMKFIMMAQYLLEITILIH